jgi:cytochrome c oxidase subunit 1
MTAIAEKPTTGRSMFRRPTATTGRASWFTTVDHKKIGIMYFFSAMFFFLVGGIEALLLRLQLAGPNGSVLSYDQYNQLFTMHGITMVFFVIMPLGAAFMNYLLPLQLGARDVAFPRLNGFSYWVFLAAGIFTYSSIFLGGWPDGGWFGYAPLSLFGGDPLGATLGVSSVEISRMLFYSIGLQIAGIASLASAINFIVTILNMRAPGMTLLRMPVFTWMTLVVAFLLLFAIPVIGVALWQMMFDTGYGANFFRPSAGGDPILWQHLFWLFGHPEVYILILPAFGIISEVLPTFSRKPLFGYTAVVFSGIAIGFMGWGVWAHHMFAAGLGPVANAAFGLTTMFIAVPTGIKIFNWMGTMWGGNLRFPTAMLFAIGLVAMFTIGGLSGVTHGVVPHDYQQTDTYYVVAHFHYVLFGGALFGFYSGAYYWFPKVTGRFLNEGLGKLHFWLSFIGFNLTFGPMHIVGLNGMPRRVATYPEGMGWDFWNLVETIGAFVIAVSVLVFLVNLFSSLRGPKTATADPWDARTLEWLTTSPPPAHNFDVIPVVHERDEVWHRKYGDAGHESPAVPAGGSQDHEHVDVEHVEVEHVEGEPIGESGGHAAIHMPDPSYYPLIVAAGMPFSGWGVIFESPILIGLGLLVTLAGIAGWVIEPSAEETH